MRELSDKELRQVSGGKITQTNGGGNIPKGEANGVPASNPAGKEPAGQNK
jgi:bacteriocin-like protein